MQDRAGGRVEGDGGDDHVAAADVEAAQDDLQRRGAAGDGDGVRGAVLGGEGLLEPFGPGAEGERAGGEHLAHRLRYGRAVVLVEHDAGGGNAHGPPPAAVELRTGGVPGACGLPGAPVTDRSGRMTDRSGRNGVKRPVQAHHATSPVGARPVRTSARVTRAEVRTRPSDPEPGAGPSRPEGGAGRPPARSGHYAVRVVLLRPQ